MDLQTVIHSKHLNENNNVNGITRRQHNMKEQIDQSKENKVFDLLHLKNGCTLLDNVNIMKLTHLDLSNCGLSEVPTALKDLPIKDLNLSNNKFKDIPQCMYLGLEQLESLDLSHNEIERFEVEPNCCKTLRKLILCSNKLLNIPRWILCLQAPNLQELSYDFNKVTFLRCIFNNSMNFPVRKLSLKNCILREEDCKFLKECKNLEELDMSNTNRSEKYVNIIQNIDQLFVQPIWKNISILKLNNLLISVFPECITWLETLTELHLSCNDFMWLPADGLEFLVNLEVLDVSHNSISSIPEKLAWLEHVRVLKLNNNNIEIIPDFSKMKTLEILDLYYNKLYNFEYNMDITNLKYIDLECNYFDAEECDILAYLDMKDNYRIKIYEDRTRLNGMREFHDYSDEFNSKSASSDDLEVRLEEDVCSYVTTEDWDEELRLNAKYEEITLSDDEWKGFEEDLLVPRITKKVATVPTITYNEDVIFCDAD